MSSRSHGSLRWRLVMAALLIQAAMLAVLVSNAGRLIDDHLQSQARARIGAYEHAFQSGVAGLLAARDFATLRELLEAWREATDVEYLAVSERGGRIIAASGWSTEQALPEPQEGLVDSGIAHQAFDVQFAGQSYGRLHLGIRMDFLERARAELFIQSLVISVLALLASAVLLSVSGYWLTRRLDGLIRASDDIAAGQYDSRVPVQGDDEVARLADNFNAMSAAVAERVAELRFQARHDPLTGLHNRRAFELELGEALQRRAGASLYVLYVDLDQFKAVNDNCGHAAGDQLLRQVAERLTALQSLGFLARLGGDEFGLFVCGADEAAVRALGVRIIDEVRSVSFAWDGQIFTIGASVGLACADAAHATVTSLLIAADSACYAAKERGRGRVALYAPGEDWFAQRQRDLAMLPRIAGALESGRFVLYFQRIRPLDALGGDHAEVLVRLHEEDGTVVPPAHFIPAAERFNRMPELDRWIIDATFVQIAAWREAAREMPFSQISINLSGASLDDPALPGFIEERMRVHGIEGELLCFEITESAAVADPQRALAFIARAHEWGAALSLDDFGSGLSSFAYLKQFRVDYLKIDGQFVRNAANDASDRAVIEAMVRLAQAHGLRTVAEFVAEPALLPMLRALGVDYAQGYTVHKPAPLASA